MEAHRMGRGQLGKICFFLGGALSGSRGIHGPGEAPARGKRTDSRGQCGVNEVKRGQTIGEESNDRCRRRGALTARSRRENVREFVLSAVSAMSDCINWQSSNRRGQPLTN